MWQLDCEEGWAPKNWCFWTVVLEKTVESPLDSKEIQPVHPKGNQSWIFIGRTDVEAETPILWPPERMESFEKTLMLRKIEGGRRREQQRMRWLDGIIDSMDMSPGVGDGQGGLACSSPWRRKELDMTEWLNWIEFSLQTRRCEQQSQIFYSGVNLILASIFIPLRFPVTSLEGSGGSWKPAGSRSISFFLETLVLKRGIFVTKSWAANGAAGNALDWENREWSCWVLLSGFLKKKKSFPESYFSS